MCNRMYGDDEDDFINGGILRDFPSESDIQNWNEHNDNIPEEDDPTVLDLGDELDFDDSLQDDTIDEDDDETDDE